MRRLPSESRMLLDRATGRRVRQITSHPGLHHHPFFFAEAFTAGMAYLAFVSHRTGSPQLFAEDRASRELVQVTDIAGLSEWSVIADRSSAYIYFVADAVAMRANPASGEVEEIARLKIPAAEDRGMVGAAMGTTALSPSGRWWAIPVPSPSGYRLWMVDTQTGETQIILEGETIGHPQFCPDEDDLLLYAGPMRDRIWLVNRDGTGNRRLYQREHQLQWVTHEIWWPRSRSLLFVDWPNGLRSIDADTGKTEWISRFPVWHGAPDREGKMLVCDTNFPDIGLHLISLIDKGAEPELLCKSEASSMGDHWAGPFPYNDGPIKVHAPQHTHPHPRFAPDGKSVIFTSDRSGQAQLYEISMENDEV